MSSELEKLRKLVGEYDQLRDRYTAVSGMKWSDLTVYRVLERGWWIVPGVCLMTLTALIGLTVAGTVRKNCPLLVLIIGLGILAMGAFWAAFENETRARKYRGQAKVVRCLRARKWIPVLEEDVSTMTREAERADCLHEKWIQGAIPGLEKVLGGLNRKLENKLEVRIEQCWAKERCLRFCQYNCGHCGNLKRDETAEDCWSSLEARPYFKVTLQNEGDFSHERGIRINNHPEVDQDAQADGQKEMVLLFPTDGSGYADIIRQLGSWVAEKHCQEIIDPILQRTFGRRGKGAVAGV